MAEHRYEKGDYVLLKVKARVVDVSDAHGLCYEMELDQRDYTQPRKIWVENDEIDNNYVIVKADGKPIYK